jgi:glycosyltransferase involved in cell wall biosynthesis
VAADEHLSTGIAMKIVYLTHQYFPHHVGGTEVLAHSLAKRAQAAGHEVVVITCVERAAIHRTGLSQADTMHDGIRVIEVDYNLALMEDPATAEYDNSYMREVLTRLLADLRPNMVHILHLMKWSTSCIPACEELRIPVLLTLTDYWLLCPRATLLTWDQRSCNGPNRWFKCVPCLSELHDLPVDMSMMMASEKRRDIVRRRVLQAHTIMALSEYQKKLFVKNGYPAQRISVIRHGVEDNVALLPAPSRPNAGPLHVGMIASFVKSKGIHLLVEALASIPHAQLNCTIYGAGDQEYYRRIASQAQGDRRIRFGGTFEPQLLSDVLQSFDVLAMPALWYENEPLVLKAAIRTGLPVLVADIGSLPEMVPPEAAAKFVKAGCVKSWAKAILDCVDNPPKRYAPPPVVSMDDTANAVFALYDKMCTGSGRNEYANSLR